jgi:hypothetical protein
MMKNKKPAIAFLIAGFLLSLLPAGSARSQAVTTNVTAKRAIDARYNAKGIIGLKNYGIVTRAEDKEMVEQIYDHNRSDLSSFYKKNIEYNGIAERFRKFTSSFGDAEEMKLDTYVTAFDTPHQFVFFAHRIEKSGTVAAKEAGYTYNIDKAASDDINGFFKTYFQTNAIGNVDAAYAAFKKEFPDLVDYTWYTASLFRTYKYVPGLLRYVANETVTSITDTKANTIIDEPGVVER